MSWQPIETAPKDDTHILGYAPGWVGAEIGVMIWSGYEYRDWSETHSWRNATHWMPLPSAPIDTPPKILNAPS